MKLAEVRSQDVSTLLQKKGETKSNLSIVESSNNVKDNEKNTFPTETRADGLLEVDRLGMDLIKYPSGKYRVPTNSPVPTSAGSRLGDNRYPLLSFDFSTSNKPSERNRNANPTLHTSASEKLIEIRERSDQMKDDTTLYAGNGESTDIDRELSFTQASHSRKPRHSSISYYEVCATCEHPVENAQIQKTCSTGFRADLFNNSSSDLDNTSSSEDSKANDDDEEEEIFKSPANAVCTSVDGKPSSIKPSKATKACFSPFAYSKLRAASKPHVENAQMRKTRTPDFRADLFNGIGNNFGSRDLLIDVKDNYDDEEYAKISLSPGNEVYTSNDGRRSSMKSSSSRKAYYSPDAYCEVCNTRKIPVESAKLKKSLSTCFLADLYSSDSDDLSSRDLSEDEKKNDDYEEEDCGYGKADGHLGIALSAAFLNPIFGMLAIMAAGMANTFKDNKRSQKRARKWARLSIALSISCLCCTFAIVVYYIVKYPDVMWKYVRFLQHLWPWIK